MVTEETSRTDFEKSLVSCEATLDEAFSHMNNEAAVIVDSQGLLCGLLTDGDLRRAFLTGAGMQTKIKEIMTKSPLTISPGMDKEKILALMLAKKIRHLPIVDEDGYPIGLELLKNHYEDENLAKAVLMAGGKGTRLRPLTYDTPKPLLKVGENTILDNVLDGLKNNGINDVVISVNYLGEQIKQHISENREDSLNIDYVEEEKALGTAGALSLLSPRPQQSFIVMNADLMTEMDFRAFVNFHREEANDFSVCVRKIKNSIPFGVVKLTEDNRSIKTVDEKPEYEVLVNAGIYMIKPELLDLIPENTFFDMVSLINKAIANGYKVGAFPIVEYWRDIGRHQEIKSAREEWHDKCEKQTVEKE
jgi:dTDP-glucose pyrophosphorylase